MNNLRIEEYIYSEPSREKENPAATNEAGLSGAGSSEFVPPARSSVPVRSRAPRPRPLLLQQGYSELPPPAVRANSLPPGDVLRRLPVHPAGLDTEALATQVDRQPADLQIPSRYYEGLDGRDMTLPLKLWMLSVLAAATGTPLADPDGTPTPGAADLWEQALRFTHMRRTPPQLWGHFISPDGYWRRCPDHSFKRNSPRLKEILTYWEAAATWKPDPAAVAVDSTLKQKAEAMWSAALAALRRHGGDTAIRTWEGLDATAKEVLIRAGGAPRLAQLNGDRAVDAARRDFISSYIEATGRTMAYGHD